VAEPARFAALDEVRVPLGGRLERIDLVGDGLRVDQPLWYDTEMEAACDFRFPIGGVFRCLPGPSSAPQAQVSAYFTDSSCAGPAVERATFADGCGSAPEPRYALRFQGGLALFALGEPVRERLYTGDGKFCSAIPDVVRVWTVGAEIPFGSLVAGTEEVEAVEPR
jgi:hypothetical protein